MRRVSALWLALLVGCVGDLAGTHGGTGEASAGPEGGVRLPWSLSVDTSATDAYAPAHATSWNVSGRVTASHGIGPLTVAGSTVPVASDGSFAREVPITPGVTLVPIEATDAATPAHSRQAHRSILAAEYLPEGHINPTAAALTLTNDILASLAAPLASRVAGLSIAEAIGSRPTLTDGTCTTYPDDARHGTPTLELVVSDVGELWLVVTVPNLYVQFHGSCSALFFSTDIYGEMATDVVMRSRLTAPAGDVCISGFDHEPPVVELAGFDLDVTGSGSLFESLLVSMLGEMREGDTADAMAEEFAAQADALLGSELMGLSVFDSTQTMSLFDTPIDVHLCLTGIVTEGGTLRAQVGATASGPGGPVDAPGAPMVFGGLPASAPSTLLLDANLVGQLLFSAWRAGALEREEVERVDVATLALVVPELRNRYPAGTMATIGVEGRLPPFVTAAAPADGDLFLEIGELYLLVAVDGELLFRIGAQVRMTLELVPEGGELRPEVVDVDADVWVAEEPVLDADDGALAAAVELQIGEAASALLGDATVALPDLGGAVLPTAVAASPDGRYVEISLE